MAGTSLLVWQEGQEARRGAPPPPPPGSGGTRRAGLAAPSSGKGRYRAGWWECSPIVTLFLKMPLKAKNTSLV